MLPTLPKQLKKREASFTTKVFRKWVLSQPRFYTAAFEIKQTERDSLPFCDVKDHQLAALMAVQGKGFLFKISDSSLGQKPFDMFYMKNEDAYIVIKYPTCFVLISVDRFIEEKKRSKRKSLSTADAVKIATIKVTI